MSGVAHFFMGVGGSKIHERLAHFFIDIYIKERSLYNQITNYVYAQSKINIKVKDQAPNDYMSKVKEQCSGGDVVYGSIDSTAKLVEDMTANCIP